MKFEKNNVIIDDKEEQVEEVKNDEKGSKEIEKQIDDQIHKELDVSSLLPPKNPTNHTNNKNTKKNSNVAFAATISGIACLIFGVIGGYIFGKNENKITDPDLIKIIECYNTLNNGWYYGKTQDDVTNIVTDIMLSGFEAKDPYTFITPNMEAQNLNTDGKGLGVEIVYAPDGLLLSQVFTDSPMKRVGALKGDLITKIKVNDDTYDLKDATFKQISEILDKAGKAESTYYVKRGTEDVTFNVTPGKYEMDTAWLERVDTVNDKKIVTIRIDTFIGDPYTEVVNILREQSEGEPIDTLVLDIRNNTGGYIDQMKKISCLFAKKGSTIYAIKDKNDNLIEKGVQRSNPEFNIPHFKVLQNGMSASASEALALSLLQNNNAEIYGFTSYGKGIAQTFYMFNDNSVLRYTFGKVFGPDEKTSIHQVGLKTNHSSSPYYTDTPFYYNQCQFTNEDYDKYLRYIYENLVYLGYSVENQTKDELMTVINKFQGDYGYTLTTSYTDEVSKQIMYETYKKIQENTQKELDDVINSRY